MVLSLVVIRFEIDEEFPVIKELDYLVDGYPQTGFKYKKFQNSTSKRLSESLNQDHTKSLNIYSGVRVCREICIETIVTSDCESVASTDSREEMSGKDAKPKSKTIPRQYQVRRDSDAACTSSKPEQESESSTCKEKSGDKVPYFSGNPSVEVTKGILHLFKLNDPPSLGENVPRGELLCMLSVPAKMTCPDLLNFIAPFGKNIEHVRIIRDSTPNLYMVLLKFKDQQYTDEFYQTFNGKAFNSFESEVCHLVYVCKVESQKSSEGACLPLEGATELPTCHICLERMDESVEGILTVLCNHSFHGSCLVKWQDSSCPVCRCCQTTEAVPDNKCFTCDSKESLWICLICGHIGCGRYKEGHAHRHFRETQHTYSMELETQRVWDYTGDNYVHRLVQNKSDGKLVEFGVPPGQVGDEEKLDSITLEYTYLLTSQLESQRLYFEEKIAFVEKDAFQQIEDVVEKSKKTLQECQKFERLFTESEKERKTLEKKHSQIVNKLKNIEKELKEEREMNVYLRENQCAWQEKVASLENKLKEMEVKHLKEVKDLKEQVSDLMRHFETQHAIEKAPAEMQQEIQGGQVFVTENQNRASTGRHRKKHK